jgi:hypothetical protein
MAAMLLFPILREKFTFLEGTRHVLPDQSDHTHILSGTVKLPQRSARPLCCNYKYRVLDDLQWHDTDTKFCQNLFTGSKVVSLSLSHTHTHTRTHTHSAIFIGGYFHEIPVILHQSLQCKYHQLPILLLYRTSTVTVGVGPRVVLQGVTIIGGN